MDIPQTGLLYIIILIQFGFLSGKWIKHSTGTVYCQILLLPARFMYKPNMIMSQYTANENVPKGVAMW